ncbi:MAG: hypothetical protein ACI8UD_000069 [Planctomycetota bacterium]|jgi:hypothetical protein
MKRLWIVPVLTLTSCADGGEEDRPQSEVAVSASHHMFALRSQAGFGTFPPPTSVVVTQSGVLNLFDTSTYTLTDASGTSGEDRYALENAGPFTIYVTGNSTEPSTAFLGAYSLVADQPDYFFTDRVTTNASPRVGMFYGTRVITGQVELEGGWHVLSMHVIFDQTILSPDSVGRGAHGGVSISAGAPGTQRTISGTGFQGTGALTFGGTVQNLLDVNDSGDGSLNMTLSYQLAGQSADARIVESAANENVIFGVDKNNGDGEAGLVTMVRKFNAPTTPVDSVRVPGTFLIGGHTLFVNPSNPGSDSFVGTVTLSSQGGFSLDAVGSSGADFQYIGTYTLSQDGGMELAISGTNETWFAAIDKTYNTFTFIDDFEELRSNNTPELNFGFGVRQKDV